MNLRRTFSAVTAAALLFLAGAAHPAHEYESPLKKTVSESAVVKQFTAALRSHNEAEMSSIIKVNRDKVPSEIEALIRDALLPSTVKEDREALFYIIERMTSVYRDVTGDVLLLKSVNKRVFESRLTEPVRPKDAGGVYTVEGVSSGKRENVFTPDNIIIKRGSIVRWVNNDDTAHLLASVLTSIGRGGLFSPRVEPGQSWEYRFDTPGEYYYICFIHKVMYGKVTVEE